MGVVSHRTRAGAAAKAAGMLLAVDVCAVRVHAAVTTLRSRL